MTRPTRMAIRSLPTFEALEARQLLSTWNWNAQMIQQNQAAADFPAITGSSESVVVVDTGAYTAHPGLTGSGTWGKIIAWHDFVGTSATPLDTDGHGTGMAAAIAGNPFVYSGDGSYGQGIAPGANLIVLRTDDGTDTTSWATQAQRLANAMDWVIAHQAQYNIVAVNMSTGSGIGFNDPSLPGDPNLAVDQVLEQKFATLAADGVFLGASAGNDGTTTPNTIEYPAADPNVYSVSSVNSLGKISSDASRGTLNDLLAPGEKIVAPYYFPGDPTLGSTYYIDYATGTSFCTPQMVGAAALLKQIDPSFTPQQIIQILQDSGSDVTDSTTGNTFPLLRLDAAIKLAISDADALNNHTLGTAAALSLSGGHADLGNLTLLGGVPDYYSFTLTQRSDVTLALNYAGADYPTVALLNASGVSIAAIPTAGLTQQLAAGTYFIRASSPTHLAATYGVSLDAIGVNNPGATAANARIAYDSSGSLHLTYYDSADTKLKYALRDPSGAWSALTTVDATPFCGSQLSLAIDPNGLPGIAYYDSLNANLKYAHFNGSSWDITTVDYYKLVGQNPSLIYTADGSPVISYYQASYGTLRIASFTGNQWLISTVDSNGNVGRSSCLAMDSTSGQIGVAYEDITHGWFKYAYYHRGWHALVVDSTTRAAGGSISLLIDSAHLPEMSYYDAYNQDLVFARNTGTRWSITHVASKYNQGLYTNLAITNGAADILYYSPSYAGVFRATSNGNLWSITPISPGGSFLDEAIDLSGRRTISWIDSGGAEVLDL